MKTLACGAVTVLGSQWLFTTQLILDTAAMATTLVTNMEVRVVLVDLVWRTVFPVVGAILLTYLLVLPVSHGRVLESSGGE